MKTTINKFRIEYIFNNSKFGFTNSVTVEAISPEQATEKAIDQISGVYGKAMLKRFTLRTPEWLSKKILN